MKNQHGFHFLRVADGLCPLILEMAQSDNEINWLKLNWFQGVSPVFGSIVIFFFLRVPIPDVQAGFRKGRGTRDQIANIRWIIKKAREFQKNIYFCFIDYAKAFDCVDHNKLWKILKEMGIPDHLTHLLRNLYAGQEATVRTGHGTTDWFQIGKGVLQGCILSPCLFNLHAEYIMRNAGWKKHKLESRLPGEISITSDMQMIPP